MNQNHAVNLKKFEKFLKISTLKNIRTCELLKQ